MSTPAGEKLELAGMALGGDLAVPAPQRDGWTYGVPSRMWIANEPISPTDPNPSAYPVLEWRDVGEDQQRTWASAGGPCLDEFIRLDEGAEEDFPSRVLVFARRWGVLGICLHGKPAMHGGPHRCSPLGTDLGIDRDEGNPYWELVV